MLDALLPTPAPRRGRSSCQSCFLLSWLSPLARRAAGTRQQRCPLSRAPGRFAAPLGMTAVRNDGTNFLLDRAVLPLGARNQALAGRACRSPAPHKDFAMRSSLAAFAPAVVLPAAALAQDYDAPRNATVNAAGATVLKVDARAGQLRVTGIAGITEVRVRGTARASGRGMLEDIKLEAQRNGSE